MFVISCNSKTYYSWGFKTYTIIKKYKISYLSTSYEEIFIIFLRVLIHWKTRFGHIIYYNIATFVH